MNEKKLKHHLLSKPESIEDHPFGFDTHVYKVHGKMFALYFWEGKHIHINLKCEPNEAVQLRDVFKSVKPGYHMNKQHWNTVVLDGDVPDGELKRMIDNSYLLVVQKLKKSVRAGLILRNNIALPPR
jgi:predicted DNA-binding protein (MmcQ/YjbR family)